jgi:hypothetical protein
MMYTLTSDSEHLPMTTAPPNLHSSNESPDPPMRATYVRVVVVEALVLAALWLFSALFNG